MSSIIFCRNALRSLRTTTQPFRSFSTRALLLQQQQPSQQPQYHPPTIDSSASPTEPSTPPPSNPHRQFYKSGGAGRAVAYNFLIAMVTFQALYWGWMKLESMEVKRERGEEMRRLEGELKGLKEGR